MRSAFAIAAAALVASPAAAQTAPAKAPPPVAETQKRLTDPAMADRMARVMRALSKSFLELPVGEIEAAAAGREPTAADRKRTVREAERAQDPDFERKFQGQMTNARPMMESAMKAMAAALPAMMEGMAKASSELEKGVANLPRPNYPKQ